MIELNGVEVKPTIFPDKTSQIWKLSDGLIKWSSNLIVWRFEYEGELMHLAQLMCLIREFGGAAELSLPYLPYARQDKYISNQTTFALTVFIKLINAMDFKKVVVFDPHNYVAVTGITNVEIIRPDVEVASAYVQTNSDCICFPDAGAMSRYSERFAGYDMMYADKSRSQETGEITGITILGNVFGKRVLIVDDICDGGATFVALAKGLKDAAALSLYVSHGLFSKGLDVLVDAGIAQIFTKEGRVYPK